MNNEEKILKILVQMQQEQKITNERLDRLEAGQTELKSEMNDRFDSVELKIDEAWKDLSHLEDRVDLHDVTIKKIM